MSAVPQPIHNSYVGHVEAAEAERGIWQMVVVCAQGQVGDEVLYVVTKR